MTRSHWRSAVGVGLLVVGLTVNASGAMVAAEPGSGATDGAGGGSATSSTTKPANPLSALSKAIRTAIGDAAGALGVGQSRSTPGSSGANSGSIATVPQMMAGATRINVPITGVSGPPQSSSVAPTDPVPADPADAAVDSPAAVIDDPEATNAVTDASSSTSASQVAQLTLPINVLSGGAPSGVAPVPGTKGDPAPVTGLQSLSAPVYGIPNLVVPMATQLTTGLLAPIPDVLSSIQNLITATSEVILPVARIPGDLLTMFGVAYAASGTQPIAGTVSANAHWPFAGPLPAPTQTVQALSGEHQVFPAKGPVSTVPATTPSTSNAPNAIVGVSSLNATARTAPADAMSEGLRAWFRSYGALVIAASLSALVAAALPGLIALLIPTAAGVGVGYRQAKAGIALRAWGLARFAGSGPVGIVRSGSFVTVRSGSVRSGSVRSGSARSGSARSAAPRMARTAGTNVGSHRAA